MWPPVQRDALAHILASMQEEEFIQDTHPLHGFHQRLWEKDQLHDTYKYAVQSASSASLHWGSTLIKCHKGNEGARQNHFIFVAFAVGGGDSHELCIMKVRGLAVVSGPPVDEQPVVKKFAFGDLVECDVVGDAHCSTSYSDGPSELQPGNMHVLPSMLQPKAGQRWIPYVVELKDVQASALTGSLNQGTVYMPYVPMSSHA